MEEFVNKSYLRICNNNILPYSSIFVNDALSAQQQNYKSSEKQEIILLKNRISFKQCDK